MLAVGDDKLNMRDNELTSLEVAEGGVCRAQAWTVGCGHRDVSMTRYSTCDNLQHS